MENKFSIIATILLIIVVAFGVWLMSDSSKRVEAPEGGDSLGGEIFNQLEGADSIDAANPFEGKVNPIKDVYKNPFEE